MSKQQCEHHTMSVDSWKRYKTMQPRFEVRSRRSGPRTTPRASPVIQSDQSSTHARPQDWASKTGQTFAWEGSAQRWP
eukprot:1856830-Prymnesium_polylepis.1